MRGESCLQKMRQSGFAAVALGRGAGRGRIETVEDEEVALRVVKGREGGYSLEMVERSEGVHLVVIDLIPGNVPARVIGLDTEGEIHGAEVVTDRREAGHKRELGAADGEDERVVSGVGGDYLADLGGGGGEAVVGGADVVEGLMGVGYDKHCERGRNRGCSQTVQRGLAGGAAGFGGAPKAREDYRNQQGEGDSDDEVIPGLEIVVIGEEGSVARDPEEKGRNERIAQQFGPDEEDGDGGEEREWVEDVPIQRPSAMVLPTTRRRLEGSDPGVGVGAKEIAIVGQEVGSNEKR